MMKTLKGIVRLSLAKTVCKQLSLYSIGLLLSCCAGVPKFPTEQLIEYDAKNKVCGQYRITDVEHFKFEHVKDIDCPSVFGFTAEDVPKVLNWAQDVQDYAHEHCK